MIQLKVWTWVICFSCFGSQTESYNVSLNGSKEYIVSGDFFTLTCSSSTTPAGEAASFSMNNISSINVRSTTTACYGILSNGTFFICDNRCSCSSDNKTFTWTFSGGIILNKSVIFKCQMLFGDNNEKVFRELLVDRAYGPSSVSLYPDSQPITKNETDLLGPIHCIADCVPNCTYKWSGPGVIGNISVLQIPNILRNQSGRYTCMASNTHNYRNATVDLEISVQYGPNSVILNPSNTSYAVEEGTSIGPVNCSSPLCNPECKYDWIGPGKYAASSQLYIPKVQREHTGQFTCTASNVASIIQKKINITVEYGPSHVSLNPNRSQITVNESDQISPISCTANCIPFCTYKWDGPGINGNISVLQIKNISRTQKGTYTCAAKNVYGTNVVVLQIIVQFGPDNIALKPTNESYTVKENTSVGPINCTSLCYPDCVHEWIGPGILFMKNQLLFNKITRNNTGQFTCTASNIVSYLRKEITINVEYGPLYVFLNPRLSKITVNESEQVGPINCTADCVPACSYIWSGPGISETHSGLNIEHIRRDQNGTFSCTAKNSYGENTVDIHIVVQYGPSEVKVKPSYQTYTIKEFDSLNPINCSSICLPNCSFYWTGPALLVIPDKPLHLTNIHRNQTGNYTCISYNVVGMAQARITVTVLFAARVMYVNTSRDVYEVEEYSNVTFLCGAEGSPIPDMTWYHVNTNGTKTFLNTTKTTQTQYDLSFAECTDTGTYICEANNKLFPLSNKSRDLNITCAPRLQNSCSSRRLLAVKNNATLSLAACFLSNPVPNVNWTLVDANNSILIENQLNTVHQNSSILYTAVLETKLINKRQEQYDVYAYNSFGKSNVEMFTVVVEDRPFEPKDVMVTCNEINTLYWTSNFNGGSEQVFRVIYFENNITATEVPDNISDTEAGNQMYTVLKNLQPNKHYTFQVVALNKFNRTASDSVYCLTAATSSVSETNISGVIGGITGTTLAIVLIAIGIVVFWRKRRNNQHKSDAESRGRKKLTPQNKEDEEDGLKENILYESAEHDFDLKQEPMGAEYATVTKNKQNSKFNKNSNIQETALYSEVTKSSTSGQNADVCTNVVKSKHVKRKNKEKKKEYREDVYENMSGEAGNIAFNFQKKESRNKDGLVYADLIFNASPNGPRFIHGIDDRTIYADVDTTQKIDPLPDSDEEETNENKPTDNNKTDRNID